MLICVCSMQQCITAKHWEVSQVTTETDHPQSSRSSCQCQSEAGGADEQADEWHCRHDGTYGEAVQQHSSGQSVNYLLFLLQYAEENILKYTTFCENKLNDSLHLFTLHMNVCWQLCSLSMSTSFMRNITQVVTDKRMLGFPKTKLEIEKYFWYPNHILKWYLASFPWSQQLGQMPWSWCSTSFKMSAVFLCFMHF